MVIIQTKETSKKMENRKQKEENEMEIDLVSLIFSI